MKNTQILDKVIPKCHFVLITDTCTITGNIIEISLKHLQHLILLLYFTYETLKGNIILAMICCICAFATAANVPPFCWHFTLLFGALSDASSNHRHKAGDPVVAEINVSFTLHVSFDLTCKENSVNR